MRVPCRHPCRSPCVPAARLRRTVGPLASRKAVAGQSWQRDIIGHNRASSEHSPGLSGPIRAYSGHERIVACRIVCCRSRRPVWPVACGIVCRRIACGKVGRVRKEPVPDRVPEGRSRAVSPVAGSRAVGPVAGSRLGVCLPVSATWVSLPCSRSGIPKARRRPCPGPTAPVADAATGGLRTSILLHGRGVPLRFSRRRG